MVPKTWKEGKKEGRNKKKHWPISKLFLRLLRFYIWHLVSYKVKDLLWFFAKRLTFYYEFSSTCQFGFLLLPGTKNNSTKFIKLYLSDLYVVPIIPRVDKARSFNKSQ